MVLVSSFSFRFDSLFLCVFYIARHTNIEISVLRLVVFFSIHIHSIFELFCSLNFLFDLFSVSRRLQYIVHRVALTRFYLLFVVDGVNIRKKK